MSFRIPVVSMDMTGHHVTVTDELTESMQRHRRELHVHCYRMLGSFEEAEDVVQEVFLRAWRSRDTYAGRASLRAWLYRIATNACLDVLRRETRRGSTKVADMPWLSPYPDQLLDELAPPDAEPDAQIVAKETIELAFLAAIQVLPPRQRAVLILRDVLGWSAAETASFIDGTVAAVNSALQRARAALQHQWPGGRLDAAPAAEPSETERRLLQRYIEAHERADADRLIELLRDDVRLSITALGTWDGRETVAAGLKEGMNSLGTWRVLSIRANRQPAAAGYLRRWGDDTFRAFAITLLRVVDGGLAEMAAFERPDLFPVFGLPATLDDR
jgi:RNA polymerase sigma-70 factor, ECF subfamily